jgi:lipopolysaccharide transport system ATP-binding protein
MQQLVSGGHTLLFVSHDLQVIEAICARGALLAEGKIAGYGNASDVVAQYIKSVDEGIISRRSVGDPAHGLGIDEVGVVLTGGDGQERHAFDTPTAFTVELQLVVHRTIDDARVSIGITDGRQGPLILCSMLEEAQGVTLAPGRHRLSCSLTELPLAPRTYEVWVSVRDSSGAIDILDWHHATSFRVVDSSSGSEDGQGRASVPWMGGPIRISHEWTDIAEDAD